MGRVYWAVFAMVGAAALSVGLVPAVAATATSQSGPSQRHAVSTAPERSMSWNAPTVIDPARGPLGDVSCASASFCAAIDATGNVVTYDGDAWSAPKNIGHGRPLDRVSCPTPTFCAVSVGRGKVITFNGTSWSAPMQVTTGDEASLWFLQCTSAAFCLGIDVDQQYVTFNGTTWSVPASVGSNLGFDDAYCVSASFCVAIVPGESGGKDASFAATFDGSTWSTPVLVDPTQDIFNVTCVSASFCVGYGASIGGAAVVTFNGSSWSGPTKVGDEGDTLGVSCSSASFCLAVGVYQGEVTAATFDGSTWTPTSGLEVGSFAFVIRPFCETASFCVAIGTTPTATGVNGFATTFNGSVWSAPATIDPSGQVASVSCVRPSFCATTDTDGYALTLDGSSWTSPDPVDLTRGGLSRVSCTSKSFCAAIDTGNALTFNGTSWSAPVSIDPRNELKTVSCVSRSFCLAEDAIGDVLRFNGLSWSAPRHVGYPFAGTQSLSCASTTFCVLAAGPDGHAEVFNGTTWQRGPVISSSPSNNAESDGASRVSCASRHFCLVVFAHGRVVRYNGSTWTTPRRLQLTTLGLYSLSCVSPSFCMLVGDHGFEARYNGTRWISHHPHYVVRSPVSCTSRSFCVTANPSAFRYDGSAWSAPVSGVFAGAVSCASSTFCVGVDAGFASMGGTTGEFRSPGRRQVRSGGGVNVSARLVDPNSGKPIGEASVALLACRSAVTCTYRSLRTLTTSPSGRVNAVERPKHDTSYEWFYLGTGDHPSAISGTENVIVT
jgi:hypothetical protein